MYLSFNKNKHRKIIGFICCVFCVIFVFWILYSTPMSRIDSAEKEVESVSIIHSSEEVTLTDVKETEKIFKLVNKTRTKIRIFFYDEELIDQSDSGFLLTVNFKDKSSETFNYSGIYNGFILKKDSMLAISFRNQELFDLVKSYFNEENI